MARSVVVVGAGVIGLTIARRLQTLYPALQHTIIAKNLPSQSDDHPAEYASMWAGAHMRPIPFSSPDDDDNDSRSGTMSQQLRREAAWFKQTARFFDIILRDTTDSGVTKVEGIELLEDPSDEYLGQTAESFEQIHGLKGFKTLGDLPAEVKLGYRYDTFCINSPTYCEFLIGRFKREGGNVVQATLASLASIESYCPDASVVINATGMGFEDTESYPVKGQTVKTTLPTKPVTVTRQNKDGSWNFIIPRFFNGNTIIGGTKEPNNTVRQASLDTRDSLLKGGAELTKYACEKVTLAEDIRVLNDIVGFRPAREGGMRIEKEEIQLQSGRRVNVVHAYGAGGRGYEISFGVGEEVRKLVAGLIS